MPLPKTTRLASYPKSGKLDTGSAAVRVPKQEQFIKKKAGNLTFGQVMTK